MTEAIQILLGTIFGSLLAILYFGGLWWTVRRLPIARHPSALYFGSLLLRLAIVLAGLFIVLVYCDWPPLAGCLIGFLGARLLVIQVLGCCAAPLPPVEKAA
jgi:F1F0 ATPase subunit 2